VASVFRTRPSRWGLVLWLGLNGAVPALGLGLAGASGAPWGGPSALFVAHACAVLFFLVILWPLLIPAVVREARAASAGARAGGILGAHLALFAALGAPFSLLCARLAGVGAGPAAMSLSVLAAAALAATTALAGDRRDSPRVQVAYQLAAWTLCSVAPFAHYLGLEWGGGDWTWLACLSPFRGVADPGAATGWGPLWAVQSAGYAAAAAVLAAGPVTRGLRGSRGDDK
jgi:hypothetical protein